MSEKLNNASAKKSENKVVGSIVLLRAATQDMELHGTIYVKPVTG